MIGTALTKGAAKAVLTGSGELGKTLERDTQLLEFWNERRKRK